MENEPGAPYPSKEVYVTDCVMLFLRNASFHEFCGAFLGRSEQHALAYLNDKFTKMRENPTGFWLGLDPPRREVMLRRAITRHESQVSEVMRGWKAREQEKGSPETGA